MCTGISLLLVLLDRIGQQGKPAAGSVPATLARLFATLGCLANLGMPGVNLARPSQASAPNYVSHSANEYLHVPGVSRQEFNKASAVSP